MSRIRMAVLAAALAAAAAPAQAQLVANGGFESGDLTGWNTSGNCGSFTGVTTGLVANSGTYGFFSGAVGSACTISQAIATTAGQQYTFSFWVNNQSGTPSNSFQALFGGQSVYSLVNSPSFAYTQQFFPVTATSNSTTIEFVIRHDPSFYLLDDVSVVSANTTVPEPSTYALMAAGLLGIAAARRRRLA